MVWVWGIHFLFLFNSFLLWKPPPPCSRSPWKFSPLPWRSGAFRRPPSQVWWRPPSQVWWGGTTLHCLLSPPGGSLFVEEGEAAPRKPWGAQCGLHIQATGAGSSATMAQEPLIEQLLHSFPREHSHQMCPLLYLIFLKIIIKQYIHILQFWKIKGKISFCFLHKWLLCMQSLTVPVVIT